MTIYLLKLGHTRCHYLDYVIYAKYSLLVSTEEDNSQADLDQWLVMERFFEITNSTHTLAELHVIVSIPLDMSLGVLVRHDPLLPIFFC